MKKKYIFGLLAVCCLTVLPACEKDYEDSTSIHFYGEGENPPLKGSDADNASTGFSVKQGDTAPYLVDLRDYDSQIKANLGMTLDEAIAGLSNGSVRFLPVNPGRRTWDKTPANAGENAWYFSSSGIVTDENNAAVVMKFDPSAKTVSYSLTDLATGIISVTCGFVKTDDSAYPVNFRLRNIVTVLDKSMINVEGIVPAGDYNVYQIVLDDYADAIDYVFGAGSSQTFAVGLDEDTYVIIPLDGNGSMLSCTPPDDYTAGGGGYWMDSNHAICNWGVSNMQYFIERAIWDDEGNVVQGAGTINVGRAPGWDPGTKVEMSFIVALAKDTSKCITFICDFTFE